MEAIRSSSATISNQSTTSPTQGSVPTTASAEFDKTLRSLLVANKENKVSEEEVFSALVQERIKQEQGEEALGKFKELLTKSKDALRKPDGFVPVEDATKNALKAFRESGAISAEQADKIYSQAFAAAQLDGNTAALFDDRGGPGDSSVATSTLEQALLASRTKFENFAAGSEVAPTRSIMEESMGKIGAGSSSELASTGFLFKPISDSDGKLAILLPPKLAGMVAGVRLIGPSGEVLESGRFSGNGNGGRDHYRFSRPGASYLDGLTVELTLKTNELIRYVIDETSERSGGGSPDTRNGSNRGGRGSGGGGGSQEDTSL